MSEVKVPSPKTEYKDKKLQLMEDISTAKIKALYFKEQGNKRAWDSWNRVVECLESKLKKMKGK